MVSVQILALAVALSSGSETVLLDFHAPWCAPCRSMDGTVEELERAGYPVRKVNVDEHRELAAQHHVESIPCFVLLVGGREVARLNGAVRRGELLEMYSKAGVKPEQTQEIARAQSPDPPLRRLLHRGGDKTRNPFLRERSSGGVEPVADLAPSSPPATSAPPAATGNGPSVTSPSAAPMNLPTAASAAAAPDPISTSVRLTIADPKGSSYGSGTLIDTRSGEALVLTCGHIFRDSQGSGQITVDLLAPGAPQKLPGRLVAYDLKNDIGLVSIRPGVPVAVALVAPKGYRMAKGDRVTTVGCNNGGAPTAIETRITAIDKFLGPPNVQVAGLPVQGRSGGGLFSNDGQVIGVCNAADPADNEGLYAALGSIQTQLDKIGLSAIYESPVARERPAAQLADDRPAKAATIAATSSELKPDGSMPPAETKASPVRALSDSERVALAEAHRRGDSAEVVCIVRSLADPRAKSEVIMLDRASSAFLKQLAVDRQAQEARHTTSHEVRGR